MKEEIITKMFKALGHPLRYKIVNLLLEEPKCVCEIEPELDFSKPNLSQHLKILKEAGILESDKRGLKRYYKIKNLEVKKIIKLGETFYEEYIKDLKGEINEKA